VKLTKEEKDLLESIERGEFRSLGRKEKERIEKIVRQSSRKNTSISIRMNEDDLKRIKLRAKREGVPYQTLITSILHKYINESLIDIKEASKIKKLLAA
jgi:predicted DNA binding CopG/RHH family protein